jgi:hypothetical protein
VEERGPKPRDDDPDVIESTTRRVLTPWKRVILALAGVAVVLVGIVIGVRAVSGPSGSTPVGLALRGGNYGPAGVRGHVELAVDLVNTARTSATVREFRVTAQGLRLVSVESNWPATLSDPRAYRITPAGAARLTLELAVSCSVIPRGGSLRLEMTRPREKPRLVSLPLPQTLPSPTGDGRALPLGRVLRTTACAADSSSSSATTVPLTYAEPPIVKGLVLGCCSVHRVAW